jgi:chromate transporter
MSESAPDLPLEPPPPTRAPPTLLQLASAFCLISLSGFGGVLYWSRRMMVERRRWMTAEEFNAAYALCNFLPGPNIVNFSVVFGRQVRGTPGAIVALASLLGPPFVLVTLFGLIYALYGNVPALQRMFAGVAAAAAGLTISTSIRMAEPLVRRPSSREQAAGIAAALAALVCVGVLRWPMYFALPALIPMSIGLAWWARR